MLTWVEPFIWKLLSVVGDLMAATGLLLLLLALCLLFYRGTEALIEKGAQNEDQD